MDELSSWGERALAGVERLRGTNGDVRGRVGALLFLLRGAYFTGDTKWRRYAEADLRALWRGGVHDHIGGGFFSHSADREWLRPSFEKRLDDNARLAFLYTEAWESGHMAFYREAAESTLDWILRELGAPSGLYCAGQFSEAGFTAANPYLLTPAQLAETLGADAGRHFGECYDITDEPNCGEASIPNLLLNERWSLIGESYDDDRERLRAARETKALLCLDARTPPAWNAMALAAFAKAGRVFDDPRYRAAGRSLAAALEPQLHEPAAPDVLAALLFAYTELYAEDYDPAHLLAASAAGRRLAEELRALPTKGDAGSLRAPASEESDRAWALAALGFDALHALTQAEPWREARGMCLQELCLHAGRHGPDSLDGLCALLAASHTARGLVCVSPEEAMPVLLGGVRARYAPDLHILLKTPERAAALASAAPWTEPLRCGSAPRLYPVLDGKTTQSTAL